VIMATPLREGALAGFIFDRYPTSRTRVRRCPRQARAHSKVNLSGYFPAPKRELRHSSLGEPYTTTGQRPRESAMMTAARPPAAAPTLLTPPEGQRKPRAAKRCVYRPKVEPNGCILGCRDSFGSRAGVLAAECFNIASTRAADRPFGEMAGPLMRVVRLRLSPPWRKD
jgi:hypothetical protein